MHANSFLALAGSLLLAGPAAAQVTIYNNHPMTWQTPTGCLSSAKVGNDPWAKGACSRIEVSTAGTTHNIRFVNQGAAVVYVTSIANPTHVHAIAFVDESETNTFAVNGTCKITPQRFVSCAATGGGLSITNVASFVNGFPEAEAFLR